MKIRAGSIQFILAALLLVPAGGAAGRALAAGAPDLTQGFKPDVTETYNLGPTGLRGWIYFDNGATAESRQILVTVVEKGSPADGIMAVGDVILGAGGKPFAADARRGFAEAIGDAEKEENKGVLKLAVWRKGARLELELKLKVMGTYSDTAPYDCPKSRKILAEGCRYIAEKKEFGRFGIGALALLASGDEQYLPLVRQAVRDATPSRAAIQKMATETGMRCWGYAYTGMLLSEYYLATGDKAVLPGIRAYAVTLAEGQGGYGTWGHGTSDLTDDGKLHGPIPPYGALNQAGLMCFISLVLAQKCGVEHEEIKAAIGRSGRFFGYYAGKGAIPYGEHAPIVNSNNDNGKNGTAALAFALLGRSREAQYFAKTVTASRNDREWGHTGPFFGYLWSGPGANCGGPAAAAAYVKEVRWLLDLARRWDGSFAYDPLGGGTGGSYNEFSTTGAFLLTYALPQRKLCITGRDAIKENWLSAKDVAEAVEAGRFDPAQKSRDELIRALSSWSPVVRNSAAQALAGKPDDTLLPQVLELLEGRDANARIGACQTVEYMKSAGAPALPALLRLLSHEDRWLRIKAAEALKAVGEPAKSFLPDMLRAVARNDDSDDLQLAQGALAFALFYPGGALGGKGLLAGSIEGIDRALLYPAVRAVARNPDCRARGCLRSTYSLLTLEDVKALAPEIIRSVEVIGPNNTMFAKGVQLAGIDVLAKYHAEEGLPLTMMMLNWTRWGRAAIRPIALKTLKQYGGAAKSVLPELKALEKVESAQAEKELKKFRDQEARQERERQKKGVEAKPKTPKELRREAEIGAFAKQLRDVIDAIENDKNPPKLIRVLKAG